MAKRPDSDYSRALFYRELGLTLREIGEKFGVVASRAHQMVKRGESLRLTGPVRQPGTSGWTPAQHAQMMWTRRQNIYDRRFSYGTGDAAWQWVATPMIGRNDDNTMLAHV